MKNKISYKTGAIIFLAGIAFNLVVQFVFSLIMLGASAASGSGANVTALSWYSTANLIAMLFLQAAFFSAIAFGLKKQSSELFVKPSLPTWKHLLFGVVAAVVCLVCFSWAGEWFSVILDAIGYKFSYLEINGVLDIVLAIVVTVIIAPIIEETLFRNALFGGLLAEKKPKIAILMCGAAFALMHMNPQQTVYQFLLGCTCAYIVYKTGNIVTAMLVHAINNATAIALSLVTVPVLTPAEGKVSVLLNNPLLAFVITAALFVSGVCLLLFLGKILFGKSASPYLPPESKKDGSGKGVFAAAMAICGVMWIFNFIGSLL